MSPNDNNSKTEPKEDIQETGRLYEHEPEPQEHGNVGTGPTDKVYEKQYVWGNIIRFSIFHIGAVYGIYLACTQASWTTFVFGIIVGISSALGITAGAHRLWCHRAYKAKFPFRLLLAFLNTIDIQRGFFFAHMGWLLVRKHPEVMRKGKTIDCSDLLEDPIVYYQWKFYFPLSILCCFVIPAVTPWYFWGEDLWVAFWYCSIGRYILSVHGTWLVNSAAHLWGQKPYDKNIGPVEQPIVGALALGEGWHNYHHVFPWDYKTSELPWYHVNLTTMFIDAAAYLGQAYDLKTVDPEVVEKRVYEKQYVWRNIYIFSMFHIGAVYGLYLAFTRASWTTFVFGIIVGISSALGITAGAHRLWCHRAYKAKFPFRLLLAFLDTMDIQNSIYVWSRDHRVHHKFSETDADPHNAKRGFFFAHMGWLLVRKHPEVMRKGKTIDFSDLLEDPIVYYQRKFYVPLAILCCFVIPAATPWYFWGEDLWVAFWYCSIGRYILFLHGTFLVNSAAHLWGQKPYDKNIGPVEQPIVGGLAFGEGWHNYHHVFPWDYKTSELPWYHVNLTTMLIDAAAYLGQAYDLKTVDPEVVEKRVKRTGDGSHFSKTELKEDIQETGRLYEHEPEPQEHGNVGTGPTDKVYEKQYVWRNIYIFSMFHIGAVYGLYLGFTRASWTTFVFGIIVGISSALGVTAGAHRLWCHRAYKAKFPFRLLLAFLDTMDIQNSIYVWSRDHRLHHKFSETDADPHNAKRGFFFAHMGWLLVRKHPEVMRKGKTIDCSDLLEDPIVYYQRKYYLPLGILCCFVIPAVTAWYFLGEDLWVAFWYCSIGRYVLFIHGTWLVNSAAHLWGEKPYDKSIGPVEQPIVGGLAFGEGWHNYHHVFPWDYKTSELPWYHVNLTTMLIDAAAYLGQVYDRKTVDPRVVERRVKRTGFLYFLVLFEAFMLGLTSSLGVTAGAHRLWSHGSYKAKFPFRFLLAFLFTCNIQNDIYVWSRDHRLHHKFSETDADPHNAKRGFFFAHMGWLFVRKHPEVMRKGKTIDCSDLLEDPIVYYQRKFYAPLALFCCFVFPAVTPWLLWGEDPWVAFWYCSVARYILFIHGTWMVNSAAHLWGLKPYDKYIGPVEQPILRVLAFGEGSHNYHHTFPWDYRTSELPGGTGLTSSGGTGLTASGARRPNGRIRQLSILNSAAEADRAPGRNYLFCMMNMNDEFMIHVIRGRYHSSLKETYRDDAFHHCLNREESPLRVCEPLQALLICGFAK
ncbi:unnamed protein product [Darwinula stevensoni]|uniref:Fatty acid desaturase domain-containing protein n=1 Tax=Darwinula stevensoni TaxID=69355 RepID=A0A7R8X8E6_9CRUS|nr:unnamed protein product [Darwinula stevensoni]CAG0887983.1 unnamed protein product [Darwinula stevensoni]